MLNKIAIIDLGSNTSRLIILAYTPGTTFQLIDQLRERVRLSEGMGAENILRANPIESAPTPTTDPLWARVEDISRLLFASRCDSVYTFPREIGHD